MTRKAETDKIDEKELLRVSDVAKLMGVTESRIYQLLRARELPSVRIGGAIRVPRGAWLGWLDYQRDLAMKSFVDCKTHRKRKVDKA